MTKMRRKIYLSGRSHQQKIKQSILTGVSMSCCLLLFLYIVTAIFSTSSTLDDSINGGEAEVGVVKTIKKRLGQQVNKQKDTSDTLGNIKFKGILPMQRSLTDTSINPDATKLARLILDASLHLINIQINNHSSIKDDTYKGIIAEFCTLNFQLQKDDPPELPMFRDVVDKSHCGKGSNHIVKVDLKEAVDLAREFDESNTDNLPTILDLKGVVFHESRCGSTLAANSMMALNPSKHRVYSESSPPVIALRACGEDYSNCSVEGSANLLKDVIYLMGRSNDPNEENLYFKFQSATTRTMGTFRAAFPTTPWIFLYREPIEVIMSQLDIPSKHIAQANCVRSKDLSPMVKQFIKKSEYSYHDLLNEEFCAIHLATLCESALHHLEDADGLGMAVKYSPDLVHEFLDTIFPIHFHTVVDSAARERVLQISGTYSKNRGKQAAGEFKNDSEEKLSKASDEIKNAAADFLTPSFEKLEEFREGGEDDAL